MDSKIEDLNSLEKVVKVKFGSKLFWEVLGEKFFKRSNIFSVRDGGRRNRVVDVVENWKKFRVERDDYVEEDDENEVINDFRWDKIKIRIRLVVNVKVGYEKFELRRWDR